MLVEGAGGDGGAGHGLLAVPLLHRRGAELDDVVDGEAARPDALLRLPLVDQGLLLRRRMGRVRRARPAAPLHRLLARLARQSVSPNRSHRVQCVETFSSYHIKFH